MVTKDLTLMSCMVAVADLENVQNHSSFAVDRQFLCSSFVSYSAEDRMDKKGQHMVMTRKRKWNDSTMILGCYPFWL